MSYTKLDISAIADDKGHIYIKSASQFPTDEEIDTTNYVLLSDSDDTNIESIKNKVLNQTIPTINNKTPPPPPPPPPPPRLPLNTIVPEINQTLPLKKELNEQYNNLIINLGNLSAEEAIVDNKINQLTTNITNAENELNNLSFIERTTNRNLVNDIKKRIKQTKQEFGDYLDKIASPLFNKIADIKKNQQEIIDKLINIANTEQEKKDLENKKSEIFNSEILNANNKLNGEQNLLKTYNANLITIKSQIKKNNPTQEQSVSIKNIDEKIEETKENIQNLKNLLIELKKSNPNYKTMRKLAEQLISNDNGKELAEQLNLRKQLNDREEAKNAIAAIEILKPPPPPPRIGGTRNYTKKRNIPRNRRKYLRTLSNR